MKNFKGKILYLLLHLFAKIELYFACIGVKILRNSDFMAYRKYKLHNSMTEKEKKLFASAADANPVCNKYLMGKGDVVADKTKIVYQNEFFRKDFE